MGLIKAAMGAAGGVWPTSGKSFSIVTACPRNPHDERARNGQVRAAAVPNYERKTTSFPMDRRLPLTTASA